jgi:hypothetical protein
MNVYHEPRENAGDRICDAIVTVASIIAFVCFILFP